MQKVIKKTAFIVALFMMILAFIPLLSACGGDKDTDDGGNKPNPPVITTSAPVVDMDVISTYLETGKDVDLSDAVSGSYDSLSVTFKVGEDKAEMSAADVGYNASSHVWTPTVRNDVVQVSVTATNEAGSGYGDKNVYVVEPASVRPVSVLNEQVYIGEEIDLSQDFITYDIIEATCDEATVTYMDDAGVVHEDNTRAQFDPSTMRYTVNRAGEHRIKVTINSGVNEVTGDFYFLAIDGNEFIEINYLDDLLGIYSAEDAAAWGIPEGLPVGKLAQNATLNYKLMRDLDYSDPESWVDGVIKPWTPVVASGEAGTQETGENSVFTGIIDGLGHKITGLTNICPAQAEDVTITRTWTEGGEQKTQEFIFKAHGEIVNPRGFAFFDSLNANGTVRNLTVEYKTEIDKDHYTEYGIYTPFNLAWDNYGDESIALSDVHIQNSSIYIDASNIPTTRITGDSMLVSGGVAKSTSIVNSSADVDITLVGVTTELKVGGIAVYAENELSNVSFNGDISVAMGAVTYTNQNGDENPDNDIAADCTINIGGVVTDIPDPSGTTEGVDNLSSSGSITLDLAEDADGQTNSAFIGAVAYSLGGECYYPYSDMDIDLGTYNKADGYIGGLFGNATTRSELYGGVYAGDILSEDFNTSECAENGTVQGAYVGGVVAYSQGNVYDSSFTGSMTLGGEGYKRAGGIAGRLSGTSSGSNNSIQSTTGNMVTADIALEGDVRFGGIAAVAVPGLGLTASVADNLYGGTLSVENGSGIVAGLVAEYSASTSNTTTLSMVNNTIQCDLSGVTGPDAYLLFGKVYYKNYFTMDGGYNVYYRNSDIVAGYEGQTVSQISSMSHSSFRNDASDVLMNVEALNNKHIAANDGLTWIGSYSQEEIDAMYAQYKQYCDNADSKVAYLKVGDVTTSGEVFATAWEEEGLVVDGSQVPGGVAGEQYLKVEYKDHEKGTLFSSNITVSSDELIESYKTNYKAFLDRLIQTVNAYAAMQGAVSE